MSSMRMPAFQFIVVCPTDPTDLDGIDHVLVRNAETGKVYDSRDWKDAPVVRPAAAMAVLNAMVAMWQDSGQPRSDFFLDESDGPNFR